MCIFDVSLRLFPFGTPISIKHWYKRSKQTTFVQITIGIGWLDSILIVFFRSRIYLHRFWNALKWSVMIDNGANVQCSFKNREHVWSWAMQAYWCMHIGQGQSRIHIIQPNIMWSVTFRFHVQLLFEDHTPCEPVLCDNVSIADNPIHRTVSHSFINFQPHQKQKITLKVNQLLKST